MKSTFFDGAPVYQFNLLKKYGNVVHFVTCRDGGCSRENYHSLNLAFHVNDDPVNVDANRDLICNYLSVKKDSLIFPDQCHTNQVKEVQKNSPDHYFRNTDALITKEKGICIGILTADCVPVLLYDPAKHIASAIHAGWRGTVTGIVARAVNMLTETFGSKPADILACIGPFITWPNYQVGDEVIEQVRACFGDIEGLVYNSSDDGKGFLDLGEANRRQLTENGIRQENIEMSGFCTYKKNDLFYSARRDGIDTGRFATGIMLI